MPTPTAQEAIIGKGTTLGYSAFPTPSTYTPVAKIKDVAPPKQSVSNAEVTAHDDDSDQNIPGWLSGGEATFEVIYLTATTTALAPLIGVLKSWQITLSDTHTWTFSGYINAYEPNTPLKQGITEKIKIKVTGKPVYL